ncbi:MULTISPECIES: hypothetical protein [Herbaspirillum]|uniref:Uncharacterized protein n=2 Tax=Herbaspirillum huttiense TaxID=863372 RepID=A0AAJ2HAI0_9BURK|nr:MULTISPECIES: hypothetical protein [Herbaspirillum]MDR9836901.1 hypothetical protein [Herbaspirillum huttiense]
MSKALSAIAIRALQLANKRPAGGASWHDLAQTGANASSLASLVKAGLLRRHEYPDGSKSWFITDDGSRAIESHAQSKRFDTLSA